MTSPFKFLDPYGIEDRKIFFGRDAEIAQLYKKIFESRLMLVYGQSGTGKTSIIQCGLANRFDPLDWFPIFVRRKDNINTSLTAEIRRAAVTPIADDAGIIEAINSLYLDHLRPIYIIFDQFEELFVLGSAEEQNIFVDTVKTILGSETRCSIIISMREEYIAMLQDFERAVPTLFDSRVRIEQMKLGNVEQVITGTTAAAGITLENGVATAQRIIANISDKRDGVQLSYLQVYLDKLYRGAATTPTPLLFTDALVDQTGALGDVMADFLDEQTKAIQARITARVPDIDKGAVQRLLEEMTTLEGTKQPMPRAQLVARLPRLAPVLDETLDALEKSRILRCADGVYELAHDSLAGRIADRRGSERKTLMRVEKLIRDRLAGFDQARTYLTAEEVAVVRPVLDQLDLTPAEADFVKTSSDRARRRRLLVIGGTVSIIAVLAASFLFALQGQQRATRALELASVTTSDLSFTIFDSLKEIKGTQDIRRRLLDKVGKVNKELRRGGGPANSSAPFWRIILGGDIALENYAANKSKGYLKVANKRFREAVGEANRLRTLFPADADWQRNQSVAAGRLGRLLKHVGRTEDARRMLAQAVEIDRALKKRAPTKFQARQDLAMSLGELAEVERDPDPGAAAGHYTESIDLLRGLIKEDAKNSDLRHSLATYAMRLGGLELEDGAHELAKTLYGEAVGALKWLRKQSEENLEWRADLAKALDGLARALLFQDNFPKARQASVEAFKVADDLVKIDPKDPNLRQIHWQVSWRRGEIERQARKLEEAEVWAKRSLDSAFILAGFNPDNAEWLEKRAQSYRLRADIDKGRCDFKHARLWSNESLEIARTLNSQNPGDLDLKVDLYVVLERLGEIESHNRSFKAAAAATTEALRIATELKKDRPQDTELAKGIKRLEDTRRNLENGVPLPLPKGCPPGTPRD